MLQDALTALRAGDLSAAAVALDRALVATPDRSDLLTLRAFVDLQVRDTAKAEAGFQAALAHDPNQIDAYLALAHMAWARGDRKDAEKHLAYAKRVDAQHPRALVLDAWMAGSDGEADRSLALLHAAAKRTQSDPMVLSALGLGLLERRHYAFAAEALRRAIDLSPASPALRAALIAAFDAQGHLDLSFAESLSWRAVQPESLLAQWHHARLLALLGRLDESVAELDALLANAPRHAEALELAIRLRGRLGGTPAVVADLEARVATDPAWSLPWRLLLGLVDAGDVAAMVRRWHAAAPDSGEAEEVAALLAEQEGRVAEAIDHAERGIALEPLLTEARLLLARQALSLPPEAAVARLQGLIAAASTPEQARALQGWLGQACHRAGRHRDAQLAWRRMWTDGPAFGLPLPNPEPAESARPAADGGEGRLLWGLPGSRIERVQAALMPALGGRLLLDRWHAPRRDDGFNLFRAGPADDRGGTALRWRSALEGAGLVPAAVVDALPFWDGWTQAMLHGTTLVVVLRDPRDLLLNWLAWGSSLGLGFPAPDVVAAWLHRSLEQLVAAEADPRVRVERIDADLLDSDPAAFSARLQMIFDLPAAPDPTPALLLGRGPSGLPNDFPAGTWRSYAEPLQGLFAPFAEIAVRLGYPAE